MLFMQWPPVIFIAGNLDEPSNKGTFWRTRKEREKGLKYPAIHEKLLLYLKRPNNGFAGSFFLPPGIGPSGSLQRWPQGPATSDVCATPSRSGICPVEGGEWYELAVAWSGDDLMRDGYQGKSCFKQTNGRFETKIQQMFECFSATIFDFVVANVEGFFLQSCFTFHWWWCCVLSDTWSPNGRPFGREKIDQDSFHPKNP